MNKTPHPVFAKRIHQVMDENGWSMADLARRVMLSHTSVRKWANGAAAASGDRLKRLSAVTGRPEYWFFMEPGTEGENGEELPTLPRVLDEQEQTLLSLFNQLPEAEKLRLIIHTRGVVKEMDLLKNDVYDIMNDLKK
ncbi:helix-turn-helix domain-containing protein [Enterobacter hormaechei]|uniref:helix-turn-helix domain-containing protein n=1 Tax=Enterobacter hormaechei TaxID=158836 RepID=UPI001F24D556|nr:helix-turn-helix domain-containing protein [Enterobacter hormaechei]MCG0492514.1 helix-turn-helix domain-containing protein [Enterobacter hormaechei]MCG0533455.1 helix-turn-helix domain-containing protein [Enterobacter hormaechei]MCG0548012.1 helix-turn-helix domain-containing protein [Enterobacter hormaechei]MCG0552573.1 helix-turn-helix domain-containing protein [Enterobacter hormaechei]MCG0564863.1 helix-turn-helix domain-containing protein [Enterobacter hormaechei]